MASDIHVLFVDDDLDDRELARQVLSELGDHIHTHTACDGAEAMDFLRRNHKYAQAPRPHVVMLDINMPRMDGIETLKTIKGDVDLRTIPVVVFSGSHAHTDMHLSYVLHANAYVIKPSRLQDYRKVIKKIVRFWCEVAAVIH